MLHSLHINKLTWILNRTHIIIHSLAVSFFLYHRATHLLSPSATPALLILVPAEFLLFLLWVMEQAFRWRPVTRSVFVENLPKELGDNYETRLPAIDVFICTADPEKEPTVEVMNTLISAMALDYPSDKLNVYLSDDGGAELTLSAAREAWSFATWWIPFCKSYGLRTRCPEVYFQEDDFRDSDQFMTDRMEIKEKYDVFKKRVQDNLLNNRKGTTKRKTTSSQDHPAVVEVINQNCGSESFDSNPDSISDIPLLVYIAREKRPSHTHHFKAGALNVLLRVSGLLSNSPIILVLDCDMYCTDPASAKQAICFHLDQSISPTLAFVQLPQRFHNVSKKDIYDSGLKHIFKVLWGGVDGAQGAIPAGTGIYIKRVTLYDNQRKGSDNLMKHMSSFEKEYIPNSRNPLHQVHDECLLLASCMYEERTEWGNKVGFMYLSVLEDYFTGFLLHIKGWTSVYYNPPRAQFLGITVINLNDALVQWTRYSSGLIDVSISRFSPLLYQLTSSKMSLVQRLCYAWVGLSPLYFLPVWCLATLPQLCLLHGIPLYPNMSSSLFLVMAFIFISSLLRSMYEVMATMEESFSHWSYQWRMWLMKSLTSFTYGSLDAIMKNLGMREGINFIPTNKVMDDEQIKRYQQGVYDFQTSGMFLIPLGTIVILNMSCFLGRVTRVIIRGNLDEMFAELFLTGFGLLFSWPIMEGMVLRKDEGRFPFSYFVKSMSASLLIVLGSFCVLTAY